MTKYNHPTPEQILNEKLYRKMGLSDDEFKMIEKFLGRLPNYTETGIYSVMWSEHCSYKNSSPLLKRFPTEGEQVLQGPGEGAGVVDIGEGLAVSFKMESHNHPSAIAPFQGAATGVGGILRDVFSMGARPIAVLNSLRFGKITDTKTKNLFRQAVAGMANYGNTFGVPTVGGEVYFDDNYSNNPLVNAMAVGVLTHEQIQSGIASGIGNSILYVGAPTGRDGIEGASFASVEFDEDEEHTHNVAIGYPEIGKNLAAACLEMMELPALVGIQDMGAAGLTSSSAEMASKGDCGIELNLDLVPQSETKMTAYDMMLSESQERMLLVVKKGSEAQFNAISEKYGLEFANIGHVTDDGMMRLYHRNNLVAEMPIDSLTDAAPVYHRPSREPQEFAENENRAITDLPLSNPQETLKALLAEPTLASKAWIYQQFDLENNQVLVSPGSDAGVVGIPGTNKAIAMTADCNSGFLYLNPKRGGAIAMAKAARNLVCSGARPLAITDCLNFGSPENPEVFWQLEQAIEGISEACEQLKCPVISGNVSLYNETNGEAVYPTPVIGAVGLIADQSMVTTQFYQEAGDLIVLLGKNHAELGGSQLQQMLDNKISGRIPQLDLDYERKLQELVLAAIEQNLVQSAHDVGDGGLAVALVESAFSTELGIEIDFNDSLSVAAALFGESQSRIILSVKEPNLTVLEKLASDYQVDLQVYGRVTKDQQVKLTYNGDVLIDTALAELETAWKDGLACIMDA